MKKQIIAAIGILVWVGAASAQEQTISIAALDTGTRGIQDRAITLPVPQRHTPTPAEQVRQLLSVGDTFMRQGHYVVAIQVYTRSGVIAHQTGQTEAVNLVDWKLGTAYWHLAVKEGDPALKNIARAFWNTAAAKPIPDSRCNKLNATSSACNP